MESLMIDLLIRNGVIVSSEATYKADIAIVGETIAAIGECGSFAGASSEYDAEGKYILPGLVDPHVHMAHPFKDQLSEDDFYTTSVSAAHGGTTTIIDFAIQWDKERTIKEIIQKRIADAKDEVVVDFGLHATPTKSCEETIESVKDAKKLGVPSYKVYMIYRSQGRMVDDGVLYGLLQEMAKRKGLLMVHAENAPIAEFNQELLLSKGCIHPRYFPKVKPNVVEAEAINRVVFLNKMANSRLYIAHLSTKEGLELIRSAQYRGEFVRAETCPHYLILTEEYYGRRDGDRFICSPPLRSQADVNELWKGIQDGTISIISSDHCGFSLAQKALGKGNFSQVPNGLPGIETRLPVIYTEGVLKQKISLNRMVDVLSTNAAKIFGLYPQKGAIQPGSDADLAIVDLEKQTTLTAGELHGAVDWTPYERMKIQGMAVATILRGKFIVKDGKIQVSKGYGRYLSRNLNF
jgi:dihydropyrimidinase